MTEETGGHSEELLKCLTCGEENRLVEGRFGGTSPFAVTAGNVLGIIPVGYPCYLRGVACLVCGSVHLRLAAKDLEHLRSKQQGQ